MSSDPLLIREVCAAAEFEKPSDITADGMNRIMANMKAKRQVAPAPIQARVVAMKAFTKWLADHAKLSHDPLRSVKAPERENRPSPAPADVDAGGMALSPRGDVDQRPARWDEPPRARRLVRDSDPDRPALRGAAQRHQGRLVPCRREALRPLPGENTKNGQEARQYIQADLAGELRAIVANKMPAAAVFTMPEAFALQRCFAATWRRRVSNGLTK